MPLPSTKTISGGDALTHKLEVGERRSLASNYTLTTLPSNVSLARPISLRATFHSFY